ncbi:MAG: leucine-rich repeat protein [Clostridiales bacterium]|nr:leucine-rich repeat protein [Clostridiales bacterium]
MKKKILVVLLAIASCLMLAFGLSACASKAPEATSHTHNYQWIDNGNGTHDGHCSVEGCDKPDVINETHIWGANNNCTKCSAVKSTDGHAHIWSTKWSNNATKHWHVCTVCNEKKDEANHIPGAAATTISPQVCTVCNYVLAEPIGHTHSTTPVSAKSASCTEAGNNAYYTCGCGKWFSDSEAKHEITDKNSIIINALNHDWRTEWSIDIEATTEHSGSKSHHCTRCSEKTDITEIPRIVVTEYDVTFIHNYPGSTNIIKTTQNGLITYIPSRSGYVFNGWYLSDGQTADGSYILSEKFDTSQRITQSGLFLYAEWVQKRTDDSQLYSPIVSISQNGIFSWDIITGAQGYKIEVYSDTTKQSEENLMTTSWSFPNDIAAGYYTVKIRANGDGETTLNSMWTEKNYSHHMLTPVNPYFNTSTSILSWDAVKNATAYDVRINGTLKATIENTSYDISDIEAGDYTVSVTPTRDGWSSSSALNLEVSKKRLKTPTIAITENISDCTYTVSWLAVAHANTYRIKHHNTYITVTDTSYVINNDSPIYDNNGIGQFTVCAYDSNADFFISNECENNIVKKMYSLTLACNNNSAGAVSTTKQSYKVGESVTISASTSRGYTWLGWYNGEQKLTSDLNYTFIMPSNSITYTAKWNMYTLTVNSEEGGTVTRDYGVSSYTVNFDLNGGIGTIASQTITKDISLKYPATPSRSGYLFGGWYDNAGCVGIPYDFSQGVESNITLYAKWLTYSGSVLPLDGTSITGYADYEYNGYGIYEYYAFVPLIDETITISGIGQYSVSGYLFDSFKNRLASGPSMYYGGSFSHYEFDIKYNVTAGNLYYVGLTQTSSTAIRWTTLNLSCKKPLDGGNLYLPASGGITAGRNVTLIATTKPGYTWVGWYDGEYELTKNMNYMFAMPNKDATYTARWCKVVIESSDDTAGTVTSLQDTYIVGQSTTIKATSNLGSNFVGWYNGSQKVSENIEFTFLMPHENITYTAKFQVDTQLSAFTYIATQTTLTITGVKNQLVTQLNVPSYVTKINEGAFNGCRSLTTITLPFVGGSYKTSRDTYQYPFGYIFGTNQFVNAKSTCQYYYGSSTSYTTYSYYYIPTSLKHVTITGGNILYGAFYYCDGLTSITIPSNLTSIGQDAFHHCRSLSSIDIPDSVTSIGDYAFDDCPIETASIPAIAARYIRNSALKTVTITSGTNIGYGAFEYCTNLNNITISDSITSIENSAFYGCRALTSITIPSSVTNIGESAFSGCNDITRIIYTGNIANWCAIDGLNSLMRCGITNKDLVINGKSVINNLIIPNSVTSIGSYAFYGCAGLTNVTIPNSVTSIGSYAFYGCTEITSIMISNKLNSIESYTFYGCANLTNITIPDGVTSIGSYAFYGCARLTSITIPNSVTSIGICAVGSCNSLESITLPFVGANVDGTENTIFGYIFSTSVYWANREVIPSSLQRVILSGNMTSIGSYAFYECTGLISITIPDSVTSIGDYAFNGCAIEEATIPIMAARYITNSNLKKVVITSGTSIGNYTFSNCQALTSITIPDSVTSISALAFEKCSGLTSITVSSGNSKYKSQGNCLVDKQSKTLVFGCKTSIIPTDGSVTSIGESAFSGCTGLTSIAIPNSIVNIKQSAFWGCSELTNITIPNSVTSIAPFTFYDCSKLKNITIGSGVTSIEKWAFYNCVELTSIIIPNNVKSIGHNAFYNCAKLTSVKIGTGATSIDNAFRKCIGLSEIIVQSGNSKYHSDKNCLIETKTKTLIAGCKTSIIPTDGSVTDINSWAFSGCTGLTSIVIPDSVTYISAWAFDDCTGLKNIIIGNGLKNIRENQFSGCTGLSNITIGSGVTSIDRLAFRDCGEISEITISNENSKYHSDGNCIIETEARKMIKGCKTSIIPNDGSVTSIAEYAFFNCTGLTSLIIPSSVTSIAEYAFSGCSGLTSIVLQNGITSIESGTFDDCNGLTNITIPSSVTSIKSHAFWSSSITSITFKGTKAQWNAISKELDWDAGLYHYTVHCDDGDVIEN